MESYQSTKTKFSSECEGSAAQHIDELEFLKTIQDLPNQLANGTAKKISQHYDSVIYLETSNLSSTGAVAIKVFGEQNFFKDWSSRAREELKAKGVKPNNIEEYITGKREEANKSYNRQKVDTVATDSVVLGAIQGNLNLGIDQRNAINIARDNGELSLSDYKALLKANSEETDFEANVMRRQPVRDYSDIIENRFRDKAIKDGIPIPTVDNSTNIVKDITGITKKQIPGNTLGTLRPLASKIFRDEMRKERDRLILQGMGQLSRPELDRQLDERAPEVYNNISPQIEEMVKTRLKTAQFNLGSYFDKDVLDGFDRRDATSVTALNKVLHRIGFEEDDYQGKADFLNSYRANHID